MYFRTFLIFLAFLLPLAFLSRISFAQLPDSLISNDKFQATLEEFKDIKKQEHSPEVLRLAQEEEKKHEAFQESDAFKEELVQARVLAEKAVASEAYKQAQKEAKGYVDNALKEAAKYTQSLPQSSGKAATDKGIDLDKLLSKYKYNYDPQSHKVGEGILIFVSLSMPRIALKELAEGAKRIGGILVIRGMQDNSLTKTANSMSALSSQGVGAIIHPELFRDYAVKQVPAFVLSENGVYDKLSGNVSLEYALDKFAAQGDNKKAAVKLIERFSKKSTPPHRSKISTNGGDAK